ncbi:hypothetical protein [Actinomarinicola tropica]|uniref:Uncharacterized protein n=1 Tax=Actinomarinicola tropica TaxID=2789776 RepID=A0A5Q2RJC1_9ACTN|nr:hypothetical protein [Actinomarinicola tropica]QGG94661.1 hypothetical protein GH723_05805 [Actinomarinicola tropica]
MRRHDDVHVSGAVEALLEDAHSAIALLAGTVVASPVLLAALGGRRDVASALGLYVAAIAGCWVVVGLVAGALSLAAPVPVEDGDRRAGADGDPEAAAASR